MCIDNNDPPEHAVAITRRVRVDAGTVREVVARHERVLATPVASPACA